MNQEDENPYLFRASCEPPGIHYTQIANASASPSNTQMPIEGTHTAVAKSASTNDTGSQEVRAVVRVGGWLLFFCIAMTINGLRALSESGGNVLVIAFAAYQTFVGIAVWRGSRHLFGYLRAFFVLLLCIGFLNILVEFLNIMVESNQNQAQDTEMGSLLSTFAAGVRDIASCLIWWTYFKCSKRVAATFGRNL